MREALYGWAFRATLTATGGVVSRADAETPPPEVAAALAWIAKHSLKVTEAARPERMRAGLEALSLKLDGEPAADNTAARKRTVLSNAMRYAVERDILSASPLLQIDWTPPVRHAEVDFRYAPNPKQAAALIAAVQEQGATTLLAAVPYSLRHAGVSLWINSGVDPVNPLVS
ncbi:hypothetical protein [Actinacidiphila oryziradicis]|uniref:Integrase n=1 Tax=Actinacidiphila oryziradicis TaxID=2571141 RepID=A0A4U0RC38_9ACTN|nr:hypothetical protein [Actinacidiphila oryziradicis]TJZ92080.1 hypothetical protein FCI23_55260 [Actinacidiphila oryziradicis]